MKISILNMAEVIVYRKYYFYNLHADINDCKYRRNKY